MPVLRLILLIAMVGYVGLCASLYFLQRSFLYFPPPETQRDDIESFTLKNDGVALKIWKIDNSAGKAILYFGGNAETPVRNIPDLPNAAPDYDIYLMTYRGYGGSEGKPSEAGIFADALSLYDFAADDYDEIAVIGRSLGSGVATYVASERAVERVALTTPYDSIRNVAQAKFPFVPVSFLLKDQYDSSGRADKVTAPVLILLAERDGVIPRHHSEALVENFTNTSVDIVTIENTDHLSVSQPPQFWQSVKTFFETANPATLDP